MKYVMFKKTTDELTHYVPVIFPNHLVHADVAEDLRTGALSGYEVHSAGEFCAFSNSVSGESTTLNVQHDPEDGRRILFNDYGACFE